MPLIQTDSQHYSDIADAIRDMSGNEETFYPSEMAAGVRSIPQTIAIQPIIYSLEEREVGVWTDGKPLYQKTLHATTNSGDTYIDISTLNVDKIVSTKIFCKNTTGGDYALGGYWQSSADHLDYFMPSNKQYIAFRAGNSYSYGDMYLTLQYTKTTDTPGSGTWTPSGVPAHHYSTTEQVIGTWIDGKPLYEKTVDMGSFSTGYGQYPHNIADIDYIISYQFIGKRSDGIGGWFDNNSVGNDITLTVNKTSIYRESSNITCEKAYLTIQYTKTTT